MSKTKKTNSAPFETIRPLNDTDAEAAKRLWLDCFEDDGEAFVDYYFARRADFKRTLAVFVREGNDERLVSMLFYEPLHMNSAIGRAKVAFVAGVCTAPDYRRRGAIRRLFSALEKKLGAAVDAMLLQPFDFDFYKKLGYFPYAKRMLHRVEAGDVASDAIPAELKPPCAERMLELYREYTAKTAGALERNIDHIEALIAEYALEGGCIRFTDGAYALYYRNGDEPVKLDEFVFCDEASAKSLIAAMFSEVGEFTVPLPVSSKLFEGEEAFFNMIKPVNGHSLDDFLLRSSAPFDFKRY